MRIARTGTAARRTSSGRAGVADLSVPRVLDEGVTTSPRGSSVLSAGIGIGWLLRPVPDHATSRESVDVRWSAEVMVRRGARARGKRRVGGAGVGAIAGSAANGYGSAVGYVEYGEIALEIIAEAMATDRAEDDLPSFLAPRRTGCLSSSLCGGGGAWRRMRVASRTRKVDPARGARVSLRHEFDAEQVSRMCRAAMDGA